MLHVRVREFGLAVLVPGQRFIIVVIRRFHLCRCGLPRRLGLCGRFLLFRVFGRAAHALVEAPVVPLTTGAAVGDLFAPLTGLEDGLGVAAVRAFYVLNRRRRGLFDLLVVRLGFLLVAVLDGVELTVVHRHGLASPSRLKLRSQGSTAFAALRGLVGALLRLQLVV